MQKNRTMIAAQALNVFSSKRLTHLTNDFGRLPAEMIAAARDKLLLVLFSKDYRNAWRRRVICSILHCQWTNSCVLTARSYKLLRYSLEMLSASMEVSRPCNSRITQSLIRSKEALMRLAWTWRAHLMPISWSSTVDRRRLPGELLLFPPSQCWS